MASKGLTAGAPTPLGSGRTDQQTTATYQTVLAALAHDGVRTTDSVEASLAHHLATHSWLRGTSNISHEGSVIPPRAGW